MIDVTFYINGVARNWPKNAGGLEIELNFDKDNNLVQTVSITDFDFVRENADLLNGFVEGGVLPQPNQQPGIFEGVPFRIDVSRATVTETVFDGYIDLSQSEFSDNECNVRAVETTSMDWLNDVANGFSYEYLKHTNEITSADYLYMPYVINSIPNYQDAAVALLTVYVLESQILDVIDKLREYAVDIASPLSVINTVIKVAFYVAYLVTLIVAIIKMIKDVINSLIQPVKYHACMKVTRLIEAGCSHLGLTYVPSVSFGADFANEVIMPEKYNNPPDANDNKILGFILPTPNEQDGFFKGTFGQLLSYIKIKYNAKIVITTDRKFYIERRDFNITTPQYQVPDIPTTPFRNKRRYNTDELKSNYYVKYQLDPLDKNTLQDYTGNAYQVILKPNTVINQDLVLMKGLEDVNIPFARASRKTELTVVEKIVKAFLDTLSALLNALISAVNAIISAINAIIGAINSVIHALNVIGIHINFQVPSIPTLNFTNLGDLIEDRIGMMMLETDFTSVPKIFLFQAGNIPRKNKLHSNNETYESARYVYENFHHINSFVPSTEKPNGNQYILPPEILVNAFGLTECLQVKNNNQVKEFNGDDAIIESLKWNPINQSATIKRRISKLYTNNFTQTILEPNGR